MPLGIRVTLLESKKRKLVTGMKQNSEELLHYIPRKSCAKENVEYGGLFFKNAFSLKHPGPPVKLNKG